MMSSLEEEAAVSLESGVLRGVRGETGAGLNDFPAVSLESDLPPGVRRETGAGLDEFAASSVESRGLWRGGTTWVVEEV